MPNCRKQLLLRLFPKYFRKTMQTRYAQPIDLDEVAQDIRAVLGDRTKKVTSDRIRRRITVGKDYKYSLDTIELGLKRLKEIEPRLRGRKSTQLLRRTEYGVEWWLAKLN